MLTFTTNKTSNYTAVAGNLVRADVSAGGITISLPASPAANDQVGVFLRDTNVGVGSNTATVSGNGNNIFGVGSSLELFIEGDYVEFQYQGTTDRWVIIEDRRQRHVIVFENSSAVYNNAGMATTSNGATIRRAGRYQVSGNSFGTQGAVMHVSQNGTVAIYGTAGGYAPSGTPFAAISPAGILICEENTQVTATSSPRFSIAEI